MDLTAKRHTEDGLHGDSRPGEDHAIPPGESFRWARFRGAARMRMRGEGGSLPQEQAEDSLLE